MNNVLKCLGIAVFSILIALLFCLNINFNTVSGIIKLIFIAIITLIFCGIVYFLLYDNKLKAHYKFGFIAMIIGVICVFIIPILHGSDEGAHFYKVYSIVCGSEEQIVNGETRDLVPKIILEANITSTFLKSFNFLGKTIHDNVLVVTQEFIGAKLYTFLSYIPYLIPMYISQVIFKFDIYWTIILGRLMGVVLWVLISMYTIKIMPKRKDFMALLCLMPIMFALMSTYTADLMTNSTIFLFIAIWYRLYNERRLITKKEIVMIIILGILAAYAKIVYTLIFLLIFLLPKECFKNKLDRVKKILLILSVIIIVVIFNIYVIGNEMVDAYSKISEQKDFILSHPLLYLKIFFRTLIKNYTYLFAFTTNGERMMLHDGIIMSDLISFIYFVILISSLFLEKEENKINKKGKILISSIVFLVVFILYTSLYIQYTAKFYGVGADYIYGVQIRYMIPLVAILSIISNKKELPVNRKYLWIGAIFIDFIFLLNVIITF